MKIFILHHHLNTGGVTKVIDVQIDALRSAGLEVELIVGSNEDLKRIDLPVHILPELNYLSSGQSKRELDQQLDSITTGLRSFFETSQPCLFHIHNLCLGKNPLVNLALEQLMSEGLKVLNHCHDFAEDDRPHLMALFDEVFSQYGYERENLLYPTHSTQLRYAVINGMDRERLQSKGILSEHILDLPNAIGQPPVLNVQSAKKSIRQQLKLDERKIFLYPVRVIRRKNIGEFIFLATLLRDQGQFLVTQPPKNPEEQQNYLEWKSFCENHSEIPMHFEVGQKADFVELMYAADVIISTSTQEGFGLGYLEPWLFNKPVMGRDLPEITKDFKAMGIQFPCLYQKLCVKSREFSRLTTSQQQEIILEFLQEPDRAAKYLKELQLQGLTSQTPPELIASNKNLIRNQYSPEAYGQKLVQFYAQL